MRNNFIPRFNTALSTVTSISAVSTGQVSLGSVKTPVVAFMADGAKVYIRLGTSTVAAASTANHTFVIPDGQAMMVEIPDNFTHFAAIGSGSGALTWQVVG